MEFVKFRTSLRHNRLFKRLSDRAQKVFCMALLLVGDHNTNGALMTRVGPFTEEELAEELLVRNVKHLREALTELTPTFLERDADGIYWIAKWDEKAGDGSALSAAATRMRRLREKQREGREQSERSRNGDGVTLRERVTRNGDVTNVTDKEERRKNDQLASLADGAREGSDASRSASPALDFCFWLLDAGIATGVIREHHALDKFRWASPEIPAAETILASPDMGEAEARTRAERLFAMKRRGDLRREVNVRTLLSAWDWDEIRGAYALANQGAPSDVEGL